jgi:hypothetical protein
MVSRSILAAYALAACLTLSSQAQPSQNQSGAQPAQSPSSTTLGASQTAPAQDQTSPSEPKLQLQDLPPDPHTPTPEELAAQQQQRAIAAAERLGTIQAHWGPDLSTPGLSISLTEVGRDKQPDGTTQVTYHITGSGFSPGDRLSLVRWPLDTQSQIVLGGIAINAGGTAVCGTPLPPISNAPAPPAAGSAPTTTPSGPSCTTSMQPGEPIVVKTTAASGEPVRVALVAADRKHVAAATAIPFPITNVDQGCRLSVVLGLKDAAMVLVQGAGFPPNTPLRLESTTAGQTGTLTPTTNPEGRTTVIVMPAAKGAQAGDTTVRFAGVAHSAGFQTSAAASDPACQPSVTFHWGKGSYKQD